MEYKEYTDYLIEQLTELRDLIIVIERGGDNSPDVLYKLAIEKAGSIADYVQQWREEAAPRSVTVPDEYAQWLDGKTTEESAAGQEKPVGTVEIPQVSAADMVEMPAVTADVQPADNVPADVDAPAGDIEIPAMTDEGQMPSEDEEVMEFPDDAPLAEIHIADDEADDVTEAADHVPAADDDLAVATTSAEEQEGEDPAHDKGIAIDDIDEEQQLYNMGEPFYNDDPADSPVTVGEMMSVRRAKELRRAVSLNDRFRFRRELFGNSDLRMAETFSLIDTMHNYAEARDYLIGELHWDAESPVVKDFMKLVGDHFK